MPQTIRITGPKTAVTLTAIPRVFNTLAAPSPDPGTVTFTETAVLGIFDSSDLGGVAAGWYQFVDELDRDWWALVAASGTFNAQKSPPDAVVGTVTTVTTVNGLAAGVITAASIAADAITDAKVAADVTIASVTGAVGSVATGGITAASFAAGAITAAAIAADAIGASELAADAVAEIQNGLATSAALTTVQSDTDDIQTRLPAALVGGKMDSTATVTGDVTLATSQPNYAPSKAGDAMALTTGERTTLAAVIWNALTSGMTTAASIGKKLADWVIGSPMQAGSTVVLTDASLTTAKLGTFVLAKTTNLTGFNDLSAAQVNTEADTALADVGVTTTVTGRIDTTISSRASQTSLDTLDDLVDTEVAAIKAKTDQFVFTIANQVDSNALSGATGLDAAGVRAAVGLAAANLDGQLDALPTGAELATALGTADDAVLAAITALNNLSSAQVATLLTALEADLITDHGVGLWTRNTEPDNATIGTTGTAVAALTTAVADVPTAAENANAKLLFDWTTRTGPVPEFCELMALRPLRNPMSTIANPGFVTFYAEDGTTEAFSLPLTTDADAIPIVATK